MVVSLYLHLPFLPSFLPSSANAKPFYAVNLNWFIPFLSQLGGTEVVTPNYRFPEPEMELVSIKSNLVIPRLG